MKPYGRFVSFAITKGMTDYSYDIFPHTKETRLNDRAYISTITSSSVAEHFARNENGYFYEINLPSGASIDVNEHNLSSYGNEYEIAVIDQTHYPWIISVERYRRHDKDFTLEGEDLQKVIRVDGWNRPVCEILPSQKVGKFDPHVTVADWLRQEVLFYWSAEEALKEASSDEAMAHCRQCNRLL